MELEWTVGATMGKRDLRAATVMMKMNVLGCRGWGPHRDASGYASLQVRDARSHIHAGSQSGTRRCVHSDALKLPSIAFMRWSVKICWAQAIKLFTSKPADQIGAIYFKTGKCKNKFGFFCCESECSQSKHRQRGIYMTRC